MRIFGLFLLINFFSISSLAAEIFNCEARLPQGTAQIIAQEGIQEGGVLNLAFKHHGQNQFYVGKLRVVSTAGESFLAQGFLRTFDRHPVMQIFLSGNSSPDINGVINFQIYANGNRRMDFGFGNVLRCVKD